MSISPDELILSDDFQALLAHEQHFNPFKVLGVHRKELMHSNLLAFFFDPAAGHGCGDAIVKAFFLHVVSLGCSEFGLKDFLTLDFSNVIVRREHFHIDLVLEFPGSNAVIAIENKIDSVEGDRQIQRYQRIIEQHYSHCTTRKIFLLTPFGLAAGTADNLSSVDCLAASYELVLSAFEAGQRYVKDDVADFLRQSINHIKDVILNKGADKALIDKIWDNPDFAKVLNTLIEGKPTLDAVYTDYEQAVTDRLKQCFDLTPTFTCFSRRRGRIMEITFSINEWVVKGLPLAFMFYQYDYPPAFRVLIHKKDYLEHETSLLDFTLLAQRYGFKTDRQFSEVKEWWGEWRRFYDEDDYPQGSYCDQPVCNQQALAWVIEQAVAAVGEIKPVVDSL